MINDRINKRLYYGSGSELKSKYGLTTAILPVILGDYVNEDSQADSNVKCIKGQKRISGIVKEKRISYLIDCFYGKSILTVPEEYTGDNELQISYSEFFKVSNINVPGKIEISDKISQSTIEIKIQKIIVPWEGTLEFIPGKQYEKIRLL
jgi:hypothetical protein